MSRTIATQWECWEYGVIGNAEDGYVVNDRSCFNRQCPLTLGVKRYNGGTPQAFPSMRQIGQIFRLQRPSRFKLDGDHTRIYLSRASDEYPVGEMFCTSHESLSPIRLKKDSPGLGEGT
jgi:hypothetical protein